MRLEDLRRALRARAFANLDLSTISPEYRRSEGALREAAVLVPLFLRDGEPWVLLTRRSHVLGRHPGQISFPGGRVDPGEESLAAALREAKEEVGVAPSDVGVLGRLSEVLVILTGFRLTPWVGVVPYPYPWVAHPGEVAETLEVPVALLERPGAHRTAMREAHGMSHEVHFYTLGKDSIWGATARVLFELLSVWRRA
ncbi:MAG TPA: CoA pyrophosphatase [Anaeromyxobacteraceae bacterium]|nr:CoA pyrophosphatase [Anaeromyxobacteraceae bacterium]